MLEGEPRWRGVFGPASEARGAGPARSFASGRSGWTFRLEPGDDADQLAVAERDEIVVVLAGFLYERDRFTSTAALPLAAGAEGDAAVVLAAYSDLGERLLPMLRGSFALIVWDARRDMLFCTRDLSGDHPLFFSKNDRQLLVAASHGALLASERVPSDVDRLAIARWVVLGSSMPRRTFHARIQRLPVGYALKATSGGLDVSRHWHPEPAGYEVTPDEAVSRFERLLDQAVGRYATLGPMGVFLSGGADSAAVAASAVAVSRARSLPDPFALSLVFPDPEASEEETQRALGGAMAIPHRVAPLAEMVGEEGLLAAALRLSERSWMPCVNPWEPAYVWLAREGARLGRATILTGEGGNDWFESEWDEAADLIRSAKLVQLQRLWLQVHPSGRPSARTARALLWTYGLRLLARDAALAVFERVAEASLQAGRRRRRRRSLALGWALPDEGLLRMLVDESLEQKPAAPPRSYRVRAMERKLEGVHVLIALENRFLFARRLGVRLFNPPLDPDLIEFVYGLPSSVLNLGSRRKGLARESVRRRVGAGPAARLGYARVEPFFRRLLTDEGPRALRALGGLRLSGELGIVDEASFTRALTGPGLGRELSYYQAWQTLACEAWLRFRS